jgi:hypothetical protein
LAFLNQAFFSVPEPIAGFLKTVPPKEAPALSAAVLHAVAPVDTPEWALNEMRNLLRLQHHSHRTELIYMDWRQRFFVAGVGAVVQRG